MTIKQLTEIMNRLVDEGRFTEDAKVKFRHSIHERGSIYSSVDYTLSNEEPNTLVLAYDDGTF